MNPLQYISKIRLAAILCIALAMIVMIIPVISQRSQQVAAIETSSNSETGKDIFLLQKTMQTAQLKDEHRQTFRKVSSGVGEDILETTVSATSKKGHLTVHGNFLFLHMLNLF